LAYATGSTGLAITVRGSSRRIMIMQFRPANIRLINRRLKLPRLLLALSSRKCKDNYKNIPTDFAVLTRSLHIRWDEKAGLQRDALSSQVIDALEARETRRPAMKKLTTTMMQQTLNKQDRRLTVGLDLGDRSSFYCVLDEAGEVLMEQRLSTTPKAIKEIFGAMPRSRIALETGTHSPWVSRLLSELGHEAIVAHARSVRLIGESRRKDDRIDARTLARLVRIDPQLLCPVKHRSAEAQADLTVIRARAALVRTGRCWSTRRAA
jgi:hypothetical protein